MFTGLVEDVGEIAAIEADESGARLAVATKLTPEIGLGDSVSVSGVCLTATSIEDGRFTADAINETLSRTTLGALTSGRKVNIELAMAANGRFGGHIVQGHVDGTGELVDIRADGDSRVLKIATEPRLLRQIVEKGSITVDGVSLTVASVDAQSFSVALIPETLARTTLGAAALGDRVNLETDIFAKYAEKLGGH